MVIQTRYRDVKWEETGCPTQLNVAGQDKWESKYRGTSIQVETPATGGTPFGLKYATQSRCKEPKYKVIGYENVCVCPHIAEIGD